MMPRDIGQAHLRQVGVLVAGEHRLAALPDRLVAVHARAVVAIDRLRHEGRGLAVDVGDHLDAVLVDLHAVGHHRQRRELEPELVLGGRHLVVVLLDRAAHPRHGGEHLGAHVLHRVLRRHREVALLGADVVTEIAALVDPVGIGRELAGIELEAGVVRLGRIADIVEHEELGFWSEEDRVADARGLHHRLGLLGDAAGVAVIGLAGGRLEHVADQHQGGLGKERIDAGGRRVRHQAHVGLVDRLPPGNRRAVEHLAFGEGLFFDQADIEGDVLPLSARVRETEVDVLDLVDP